MLTRGKVLLLTILCLLSLVSIGFASWTITESDEEIVYGSMHTDNVINSAEFIQLDTTRGELNEELSSDSNKVYKGYTSFNYFEYGYLDENGVTTSTANINVYLKLDVKKCLNLFGNDSDSIKVNVKIGYSSTVNTLLNLFQNSTPTSLGFHTFGGSLLEVPEGVIINYIDVPNQYNYEQFYVCELELPNLLTNYQSNSILSIDENGYIYFSINYQLTASTGEYFYQKIFQTMYMDGLDVNNLFEVSLVISSYNS